MMLFATFNRRAAFALAIFALALGSCAIGIDFDSFDNSCNEPDFDFEVAESFCSGTWGDGEREDLTVIEDSLFTVSSAIGRFEQFVVVASVNALGPDADEACPSFVYTATMFELSGGGNLTPVAHGSHLDRRFPTPTGDDIECDQFADLDLVTPLAADFIDPLRREVVIAAGQLGVVMMQLVPNGEDPVTAETTFLRSFQLRSPFDVGSAVCEAGRCVGGRDGAGLCFTHGDCRSEEVCCPGVTGVGRCESFAVNTCDGSPCPEGTVEDGGACFVECGDATECPGHQSCEDGVCAAVCNAAADCAAVGLEDSLCEDGGCLFECGADDDCIFPEACHDGVCVPAPECTSDDHCGLGLLDQNLGGAFDVAVVGSNVFVAAGIAGLLRVDLSDGLENAELHWIRSSPFGIEIDQTNNRVWVLDSERGVVVYSLPTLLNATTGMVPPEASQELIPGAEFQTGIDIAVRSDRAFVLSGGVFNTINDQPAEVRLHEFTLAGTSLAGAGQPQVVGVGTFPQVGWVDGSTIAVTQISIPSSGTDPSQDQELLVRILDASEPGIVSAQSPITVRRFNQSTDGQTAFWRGFNATPGAVIVSATDSVQAHGFRLER